MNKLCGKWLILLLVIIAIAACTNNSIDRTATVTLSGWQSNPAEGKLLAGVLQKFEATHPNIQVKYEAIADRYMDVLKTRLIGDTAADVFFLDAVEAPLMMASNVLEPLDNYISSDFDLADFAPNLLAAFKCEEKICGLPKDFSTLSLFYNKQLFREAGLTEPPHTWEELREFAKKLSIDRNGDGRIERYGLGIAPELARQYFTIGLFGGRLIDDRGYAAFASPESLKGLQLIVDLYQKDRSAGQPSDAGASSGSEMFGQGKAAMVIEGPWAIPYLKETFPNLEFGTAEVPTIAGQKRTMAYTVAYVMNKQAKQKAAAWELIAYLTGKEGMKAWSQQGVVLPSRQSVLLELGYDRDALYAPFVAGAAYAKIWQSNEHLPLIITHFNNQFISALLGEQSLESAMLQAQIAANKEIAAMNY
ncbi:MAG: ABC transporter substrate-binding protein [Richelia sp. CSU_2_1]|nr:ABC transporter substrate-binding protein [Microcoleus sp. SU_5_6]NJR21371.1 ABC transporter substrate-binding protein [Richelia sp. CSU_2_1]